MKNDYNELQSFWNTLTPEQQEQIKQSTLQDWIDAIYECLKDPDFWKRMVTAFFEGVGRGLEDYNQR